ncbi:MAG: GNAT family N-acetyltransferase [Anaerolineales bacterium]
MEIRKLLSDDIDMCVVLLIASYNPPPWNNHWTEESGKKYLSEFISNNNFIGFVVVENDEIVGAMFAHRKAWWTNDEIFIDELFIRPDQQHHGYGKLLIGQAEELSKELSLGGVTLLTNKYLPAKLFYEKNGYVSAEHVVFMYKETQ